MTMVIDFEGAGAIWRDWHASIGPRTGSWFTWNRPGAITASSVTYISPVLALSIGSFLVGEPIEAADYMTSILLFFGVFTQTKRAGKTDCSLLDKINSSLGFL